MFSYFCPFFNICKLSFTVKSYFDWKGEMNSVLQGKFKKWLTTRFLFVYFSCFLRIFSGRCNLSNVMEKEMKTVAHAPAMQSPPAFTVFYFFYLPRDTYDI